MVGIGFRAGKGGGGVHRLLEGLLHRVLAFFREADDPECARHDVALDYFTKGNRDGADADALLEFLALPVLVHLQSEKAQGDGIKPDSEWCCPSSLLPLKARALSDGFGE